mgnify:CR=1 FL=1
MLFLYKSNALQKIITISSGNNQRFCSEGWCRRAVTPGGSYGFYRQGRGWETGPLGSLYNPIYFNGGIAVHGSNSIPNYPASHGCVRMAPGDVIDLYSRVATGTPVLVGVQLDHGDQPAIERMLASSSAVSAESRLYGSRARPVLLAVTPHGASTKRHACGTGAAPSAREGTNANADTCPGRPSMIAA